MCSYGGGFVCHFPMAELVSQTVRNMLYFGFSTMRILGRSQKQSKSGASTSLVVKFFIFVTQNFSICALKRSSWAGPTAPGLAQARVRQ
jgi:hypothetical protein